MPGNFEAVLKMVLLTQIEANSFVGEPTRTKLGGKRRGKIDFNVGVVVNSDWRERRLLDVDFDDYKCLMFIHFNRSTISKPLKHFQIYKVKFIQALCYASSSRNCTSD